MGVHTLEASEQERKKERKTEEHSSKMESVLKMVSLKRVEDGSVINVLMLGVSVCCYSV